MSAPATDKQLYLYEQVYQEIRTLIENQTFQPGEKLPSMRQLSRSRQVSLATVMQVYDLLHAHGLIEIRPQSGVYVRAQRQLALPHKARAPLGPTTLTKDAYYAQVQNLMRQPGILPLGSTILSPELLPIKALNRLISQAAQRPEVNGLVHTYSPTTGLESLRRQIALRSVDSGKPLHADDVVITCGGMEALHLALRTLAAPGEIVAVENPTFWGILQAIECLGLRALEIPTDPQEGLDLEALEQALLVHPIKVLVTIPSFQNPLGCCLSVEKKQQLLQLAQRYDFTLIEDDIYGEFYYQTPPPTLFSLDTQERVILCSSFSKTLAPGFRVGWALPGRWQQRFVQLKRMSTLSTASLPQWVIAELMASGAYERHLRRLRRRLQESMGQAQDLIAQHFPAAVRVTQPEGGFVLWLELPEGVKSEALLHACLVRGFSIAPGPMFSAREDFEHCLRLSINQPWGRPVYQALLQLAKLLQEALSS